MNKKPYWFKRRRYGYGWFPVTWQGWLTIALFITALISSSIIFYDRHLKLSILGKIDEATTTTIFFVVFSVFLTTALIGVCGWRGPKPKWRWGKKSTDNPDEDY